MQYVFVYGTLRAGEVLGVITDEPVDGEGEFVCGNLGFGADAPVVHHLRVVARSGHQADDGVGVAYVDREEHGAEDEEAADEDEREQMVKDLGKQTAHSRPRRRRPRNPASATSAE